jgi:hypothetical protein
MPRRECPIALRRIRDILESDLPGRRRDGPSKAVRGWAGVSTMTATELKVKRIIVGIAGGTVLLLGIVMIVLPGPAIIVIPAGLAILATEFVWARRLLRKVRGKIEEFRNDKKP